MKKETKKILTIGGGSGQSVLLSGLRDLKNIEITAIVNMADSGGSSGRLRNEIDILPPGDVLKCVIALSPFREVARKILLKKLNGDRQLNRHNAGNMLLAMLSRYSGSFPAAISALSDILEACGTVLPATTEKATLVAELTDGKRIYSESAIDIPGGNERACIQDLYLVPHHGTSISAYPPVIDAISDSDYIIIGPGDLYTSIIAALIVPDIQEALRQTKARVFNILNIMTKFGETHDYEAYDFVTKLEDFIGRQVEGIVCNTAKPPDGLLKKYKKENAEFVEVNMDKMEGWKDNRLIYACDLLDTSEGILRHDSEKLAGMIKNIVFQQ